MTDSFVQTVLCFQAPCIQEVVSNEGHVVPLDFHQQNLSRNSSVDIDVLEIRQYMQRNLCSITHDSNKAGVKGRKCS